jgi:hypothetical protein
MLLPSPAEKTKENKKIPEKKLDTGKCLQKSFK